MGKSRLINAFGKSYLMNNFILCKNNSYPLNDIKILQFIFSEPLNEVKESVNKLTQKIATLDNSLIKARRVTVI